jgi:hypothetical protein
MNISLPGIKKILLDFLRRYHLMIFVVLVLGSLVLVVYLLNNIIVSSGESNGYVSAGSNATFDKDTIDRIDRLQSSSESSSDLNLSQGRTNPFVE